MARAMLVWQPMASMVTIRPVRASTSSSLGMAVISLDLASVLTWPRHSPRAGAPDAANPFLLGVPEVSDGDPVVGPADHRAQRDHENVFQRMTTRAPHARVRHAAEVGGDRRRHRLGHGTSQCPPLYHVADLGT